MPGVNMSYSMHSFGHVLCINIDNCLNNNISTFALWVCLHFNLTVWLITYGQLWLYESNPWLKTKQQTTVCLGNQSTVIELME